MTWMTERGSSPVSGGQGKAVFHSLRHTYDTLIIESGANAKEAQTMMRHNDPRLTMNVNAKTRPGRLNELAEKVGKVIVEGKINSTEAQQRVVNMETGSFPAGFMVEDKGFEPSTYALRTHRSPN